MEAQIELWPATVARSLFSFRRRHRVVMNDRNSAKLDQRIVSWEPGLAATIAFLSPRPVAGEMFLLTAPFIERPSGFSSHTGQCCEGRSSLLYFSFMADIFYQFVTRLRVS